MFDLMVTSVWNSYTYRLFHQPLDL